MGTTGSFINLSNCPAGQPRHRAWAYTFPPNFHGTRSHPSLLQPLPTQLNMGRVPTQVPPWKNDGKILQKTNRNY